MMMKIILLGSSFPFSKFQQNLSGVSQPQGEGSKISPLDIVLLVAYSTAYLLSIVSIILKTLRC